MITRTSPLFAGESNKEVLFGYINAKEKNVFIKKILKFSGFGIRKE
jgi:hypothetical protein